MADKTEKKVKIRLFKDDGRYSGDLFVGVNGRTWQIKRGVEVEVPECVAEVIHNAENQQAAALAYMQEIAEQDGGTM